MEPLNLTLYNTNYLPASNNKERVLKTSEIPNPTHKIVVFHNSVHHLIAIDHIIMIQAQGNYAMIFLTNGNKILTSKTLKYWQQSIENPLMLRIHASYLIHKDHIVSINKKQHELSLTGGHIARFSRDQAKHLTQLLDN